MLEEISINRRYWDESVSINLGSDYYDVASFMNGRSTLRPVEKAELGCVKGRTLLHLQCHFGLDTLSWAREGAIVTGVDFSGEAIRAARSLANKAGLEARFIGSDVYALPEALNDNFDIVFTSYGALPWLPELEAWARIAAAYVRPGGAFYMVEDHPLAWTLEANASAGFNLTEPYFPGQAHVQVQESAYADPSARLENASTHQYRHTLGEIVSALCKAGLQLEYLHEFPFAAYRALPEMRREEDGYYWLEQNAASAPFLFSIRARKPR